MLTHESLESNGGQHCDELGADIAAENAWDQSVSVPKSSLLIRRTMPNPTVAIPITVQALASSQARSTSKHQTQQRTVGTLPVPCEFRTRGIVRVRGEM